MSLTSDLISEFVKATRDNSNKKTESIVYGTVVNQNGTTYVQIDGSDRLTPVVTTAAVHSGERVTVMIKNHSATITGNITSPSASSGDVKGVLDEMSEFEILMAYKVTAEDLSAVNATIEQLIAYSADISNVTAITAEIEKLRAEFADLTYVYADDVKALNTEIENLRAKFADIADLSTEELSAINAEIDNLRGYTADFTYVSADVLSAMNAELKDAFITYAKIDFANIGEAAIENFFAKSGMIENVVVSGGTITGMLVGVTIKGDLIEGNTIVADKLVIKGDDGLYYKLNTDGVTTEGEQTEYNSLNGSIITANSITAEKIAVDDLVAFGATIGGFVIGEDSIHSDVKDSEGNTIRGIYMNKDGEFNVGSADNFVKFYKDETTGEYHLAISADTIMYNMNGAQKSLGDLGVIGEYVKISTYEGEPCIELGENDSDFKLVITNTRIMFMEGTGIPAYINNQSLFIEKAVIKEELQQGGFVWKIRSNGNLGLVWKGVSS